MLERKTRNDRSLVADGCFTIDETAEFLRMSRRAVYYLMDSGELPSAKIGKSRRIPKRACERLVEAHLAR